MALDKCSDGDEFQRSLIASFTASSSSRGSFFFSDNFLFEKHFCGCGCSARQEGRVKSFPAWCVGGVDCGAPRSVQSFTSPVLSGGPGPGLCLHWLPLRWLFLSPVLILSDLTCPHQSFQDSRDMKISPAPLALLLLSLSVHNANAQFGFDIFRPLQNLLKPVMRFFGGGPKFVDDGTQTPQATGNDKLFPDDCGRDEDKGTGKLCFPDGLLCQNSKLRAISVIIQRLQGRPDCCPFMLFLLTTSTSRSASYQQLIILLVLFPPLFVFISPQLIV